MKQRIIWLDYARVFAIISISCNHAITRAFTNYETSLEAYHAFPIAGSYCRALIYVFSRMGVPFFLMITGSLLLNKHIDCRQDISKFYKHNFGRLLLTSELWVFIAFWVMLFVSNREFLEKGWFYVLRRLVGSMLFINQVVPRSMWYIPMILCIYTIIPYVSILVNKFEGKHIMFPVAIVFVCSMVIPTINQFFKTAGIKLNIDIAISAAYLFSMYLLYVLAGYYISSGLYKRVSKLVLASLALLSYAISCAYQSWEYTVPGENNIGYDFFPMALSSVFLFAMFCSNADKAREHRAVTYISKISFGIYFVHLYIMDFTLMLLPQSGIHPMLRFLILETVSVSASVVVIALLSKISLFKKYLFMIKE